MGIRRLNPHGDQIFFHRLDTRGNCLIAVRAGRLLGFKDDVGCPPANLSDQRLVILVSRRDAEHRIERVSGPRVPAVLWQVNVGRCFAAQGASVLLAHHHDAGVRRAGVLTPVIGSGTLTDQHFPIARIALHLHVFAVPGLAGREIDQFLAAFLGFAEAMRVQRF